MKNNKIIYTDKAISIPIQLILDENISYKAKGIMGYLITRNNLKQWDFALTDLVNRSKDGRESVRAGLSELIQWGYISIEKIKDEKGQFSGREWTLFPENEPRSDNPTTVNSTQYKDNTNNKETNSNKQLKSSATTKKLHSYSDDFEDVWSYIPKCKQKNKYRASVAFETELNQPHYKAIGRTEKLKDYLKRYSQLYGNNNQLPRDNGAFVPEMQDLERVIKNKRYLELDTLPDNREYIDCKTKEGYERIKKKYKDDSNVIITLNRGSNEQS